MSHSFTKYGVSWGLFFGMLAVIITDDIGQVLLFEYLPWGAWPFTIYSGFWGILTNFNSHHNNIFLYTK